MKSSLPSAPVFACVAVLLAAPLAALAASGEVPIKPRVISERVRHDTDDPAIWVNRADPSASLVIGTDKDIDGGLFVFGLDGKIHHDKTVRGLVRPNNVDIAYGVQLGKEKVDVAVVTERYAHRLRVYRLPDMAPIDGGGIPVFERELARDCMGVALYTRPYDGALFAIVGRSDYQAPREGYLHQYRLVDDGTGTLRGLFARSFGTWSGKKEIEAIAVDNELGYVYCSDETHGIRKYYADPAEDDAEDELALFGTEGFARDHEGISIYPTGPGTGYIIVSDQQVNRFRIFKREGEPGKPHEHTFIKSVLLEARDSDGSDVTPVALGPLFPKGLFVAMSTDQTFHFYGWEDIAGSDLQVVPVAPGAAR